MFLFYPPPPVLHPRLFLTPPASPPPDPDAAPVAQRDTWTAPLTQWWAVPEVSPQSWVFSLPGSMAGAPDMPPYDPRRLVLAPAWEAWASIEAWHPAAFRPARRTQVAASPMAMLVLDDLIIAFTAHIFPLAASPAWMAAAAHAATLAQTTSGYQPVLRVHAPGFMRIFSTHPTLFGDESLIARLDEGGVGSVSRDLDEVTGAARLGGSSVALVSEAGFLETFGATPFLQSLMHIDLGFVDLPVADFHRLFTGVLDRYQFSHPRMALDLIDSSVKENRNLNVSINSDLFPNAPSESRSKNVPIFIGVHVNAPVIQVSGAEATGVLAFAMTAASTTVVLLEDDAHFPLASSVTVGAESLSYMLRQLVNIGGKTYVELSGLTRGAPAVHALGAVVTLSDLTPSYLTGFGVDTVNAVRVNGVELDASEVSVEAILVTGHPVPVVHLFETPPLDAIVTVDVNAASPLLVFSVPLPEESPLVGLNLLTNGDFETGTLAPWTAAGTVATDAVAAVRNAAASPTGLTGNYALELRGSLAGAAKQLWVDVALTVGERYAWRVRYRNVEPPPYWAGASGFVRGKSQAAFVVGTPALPFAGPTQPLLATNAWVTGSGSFVATDATMRLTLLSYLTSEFMNVSTFFDDVALVVAPLPAVSTLLVNGGFEDGTTTGWTASGAVASFFVTDGAGVGLSPFEGTYFASLTGGSFVDAFLTQEMVTVVGQQYDISVTGLNRFFSTPPVTFYLSRALLQIGTADVLNLHGTLAIGGQNAWRTSTGSFVATTPLTRLTLSSHHETNDVGPVPFPSFFDAISLVPTPGVTPGMGVPALYNNAGENPVDAILYMLALFYPDATYNAQAFATARAQLGGLRFRGLITNPGDSGTLLQRMGQQCKSLVLRNARGEYTILVQDGTRTVVAAFDPSNIVLESDAPPVSTFGRASMATDSLYTSFQVYFDTFVGGSTSPGDYAGVVYATPTATTAPDGDPLVAACLNAQTLYGRDHRLDFYADFVRDIDTAHQLLAWLVSRHAIRQDVLNWRAWLDAVPLALGQVVTVVHPVMANASAPVEAELIGWQYLPGSMHIDLTARTIGPGLDAGLVEGEPPIAQPDVAPTWEDLPVILDVLFNDSADPVTTLNPASVDLDPETAGRQTTFTDPAHGTFVVDNEGLVTFTPVVAYVGEAVADYTVTDFQGHPSNTTTITVTVRPVPTLALSTVDPTVRPVPTLALSTVDPTVSTGGDLQGWILLETFLEPLEEVTNTGIHILNSFVFFAGAVQRLVAVTGDPRLVGGTAAVEAPGPNDVFSASRLLARPLGGAEFFGRTRVVGTLLTASSGNQTTALVGAVIYGAQLLVAFNTADGSNEDVNAGPVIFSVSNLDDYEEDSFAATWVEEHEWGAAFVRIGAMLVYDGTLYVAVEPALPGTDSLDIWTYNGTTWAFHATLGTGVSRLHSFCIFDGTLYGGADGLLYATTGGAWTLAHTFTGVIEAPVVWGSTLYVDVRNGSNREIWTTTDGTSYTLLHTLSTETSPMPGVMAVGPDDALYVSLVESGETRVYVYDGVTWTLSRDWGSEFIGMSALYTAPDGRLYGALVRRFHAAATTHLQPDAEVWYLELPEPLVYAMAEWLLFLTPAESHVEALMDDYLAVPFGGDFDRTTLALDTLSFPTPGGDTTLAADIDGVVTVDYAGGVSGTNITLGYTFTDTLGRYWSGPLTIRWDTTPVPRPNATWLIYRDATVHEVIANIEDYLEPPVGVPFDRDTLELFGTIDGLTLELDGAGTLTVTHAGDAEAYGGITYQVRDTNATLFTGALYVGFLA